MYHQGLIKGLTKSNFSLSLKTIPQQSDNHNCLSKLFKAFDG